MPQFSFDIDADLDISEVDHVVDQARREIQTRYDFKNTSAKLDYTDDKRSSLTVEGDNDYHIEAITDIMRNKLAKRGMPQTILDVSETAETAGMKLRKHIPFQQGLDKEKAKKVTTLLKNAHPKVKAQIQGETVRVTSASKDELQAAMTTIKKAELPFPLNFGNYR